MRFIIALFIWVFMPVLALCQDSTSEFIFNKNLELGTDSNADYLFAMPTMVVANSKGEMYVADDRQGSILVFDNIGSFIKTIGKKGRGPGEFLRFDSISLLPDDQILVYDFLQRRFTLFSKTGEVYQTFNIPNSSYINSDMIYYNQSLNSIFAWFRTNKGKRMEVAADKDFLGHFISMDSFDITNSIIPITHTIDVEDKFERFFEGGLFKGIFTATDSTITVAPYFYRGKILHYKLKGTSWELEKVFEGYLETKRTYESFDDPRQVMGKGMAVKREKYGAIAGIMKNESLGIFQKSNGDFLYLGLLEIDGEQQLYVNLFDERGELKAHGPVTNLHPGIQKNGFYRRMRFYWMDEQDQLYVIDGAEDGFYVYRGTIELKE